MKICPRCQKTYSDDTLNFCLEDGATLDAATADQLPATVLLNQPHATNPPDSFGGQTKQPNWNTTPNQFSATAAPAKKSNGWLWALGILGGLALLCGGGSVGFIFWAASLENAKSNTNRDYTVNANRYSLANAAQRNSTPTSRTGTQKIDLSLWTRVDAASGTTEFINDEFLMSSSQEGYFYVICARANTYKTEDATTRITVRNVDETSNPLGFGLVVHSNPIPIVQDYAFLIDSENKKYRIVRHKSQKEITVVSWTRSDSIKDGDQKNVLEVRDENKKMSFYINGDFVKTIDNEEGFAGGVAGVYSGNAAKVAFSDFEISK